MMTNQKDPRQILKDRFSERMSANPRYSLRAFARDLKISPQQLSNILNAKKGLSIKTAAELADQLGMTPFEKDYFCNLAQSFFGRSKASKKVAQTKLAILTNRTESSHSLSADAFRAISDWYHFGLIELLKITEKTSQTESYFSKKLQIPVAEIKMTIERLLRLKLISITKGQGYKVNQDTLITTDGVPSEALRKFHKQVLEKALESISTQSVQERYLSTSLMAIKVTDLPIAEKMIQDFRMRFTDQLTYKKTGDEIYALGIQFCRLTQKGEVQS